jgi:hypothetical protein
VGEVFGVAGFAASRWLTWLDCWPMDLPLPRRFAASTGMQIKVMDIMAIAIHFFMSTPYLKCWLL